MLMLLTTATVGLNHHDVAPFERLTTHPAEEVIETANATAHQVTQQLWGMVVKGVPEYIGHRQHHMAVNDTVMEHLTQRSGSRGGLLPPSPLSTARASLPASSSSLSNALLRSRSCQGTAFTIRAWSLRTL